MSRKNLIIISVIAIACIAAALMVNSKNQPVTALSGQLFLPELKTDLDQVDKIVIQLSGNNPITLTKKDNNWGLAEKSGYKANFPIIREALTNLAEAKLFEAKTQKEKNYIQLGVEDVTQEKGSGSRISIYTKDKVLEDVIIGRYKINKGTYLRKVNDKQSWLTQSKIIIKNNFIDWIDTNIIDIEESSIKSVNYTANDRNISPNTSLSYEIIREASKDDFKVIYGDQTSPPKNPRFTDNIARLISELKLVDVAPRDSGIIGDNVYSKRTYTTFDGLEITVICSKQKEDKTAHITFDFSTSNKSGTPESVKQIDNYIKEISPWIFTVDDAAFGKFNKQLADIVEIKKAAEVIE